MKNVIESFSEKTDSFILWMAIAIIFGIGIANYLIGTELSFFILYLIPVSFVTSFVGKRAGFLISAASTAVWLMVDVMGGKTYSAPFIQYWNAGVRLFFMLLVVSLQSSLAREKFLARTDYLTGIANSRQFFNLSGKEIDRARRYGQPISVAYIDVDNFKEVNDTYGHNTGDLLLQTVADIIKTNSRSIDIQGRLGGDEFALLLPQTEAEAAVAVLQKLQKLLLSAMAKKGWIATFSFGAITFMSPPASVEDMIEKADRVMYSAKESGKNKIRHEVFGG